METIRNWWRSLSGWMDGRGSRNAATPQEPATPPEPDRAQLTRRFEEVQAATAAILTAYGQRGSGFAVMRSGQAFFITNGHVTNNYHDASRGFSYHGKKLFPILKGDQLAFAEHLAINPQGSLCMANQFVRGLPYRDISILRVLSPEASARALYELSFTADSRARLGNVFALAPGMGNPLRDGALSTDEIRRLTSGFVLAPLDIPAAMSGARSDSAYSLGYFRNRPDFTFNTAMPDPENPRSMRITFDCKRPILAGHSGSLLFDVGAKGEFIPLGVVTVSNQISEAHAVRFHEVLNGIDIVLAKQAVTAANLDAVCAVASGKSEWIAADTLGPSALPRMPVPENASSGGKRPKPLVTVCAAPR